MTGLDLEQFLRFVRSDPSLWINAGITVAFVVAIGWASHGRRRALQRCLIISFGMHAGLVVYGGPQAVRLLAPTTAAPDSEAREHLRNVELIGLLEDASSGDRNQSDSVAKTARVPEPKPWDEPRALEIAESPLPIHPPAPESRELVPVPRAPDANSELTSLIDVPDPALPVADARQERTADLEGMAKDSESQPVRDNEKATVDVATPATDLVTVDGQIAETDQAMLPRREPTTPTPSRAAQVPIGPDVSNGAGLVARARPGDRVPPNRDHAAVSPGDDAQAPIAIGQGEGPAVGDSSATRGSPGELPELAVPEVTGIAEATGGGTSASRGTADALAMRGPRPDAASRSVPLMRTSPLDNRASADVARRTASPSSRPLPDVPDVYRSRLAPNRSALALAAGASRASEAAVERALQWLASHQDADGRWNAGTRPQDPGEPPSADTSFTAHCPPGDICSGECFYWEADSATTGLALLAFLGAGHTHQNGPYARQVAQGLNFLIGVQKPDGDLRGNSLAVGMYCHAIAALAITEAYALTGDERLRTPMQRGLAFLVQARTVDKQAWRYRPADTRNPETLNGDTSILGWAVMALKSGKEVGVPISAEVRAGILKWLGRVADGRHAGLAMYRPAGLSDGGQVRPSMTAEAWVCRQFLGVGGPGEASDEAAAYLLSRGPDRDPYNLYYWYYATLALFQHGGEPWVRWNERVRDQIVRRQIRTGHAAGSWDPAEARDVYNSHGGRIYMTALATLTLEVYYRYLRLYDAPATPTPSAATDNNVRRTNLDEDAFEGEQTPVPENAKP